MLIEIILYIRNFRGPEGTCFEGGVFPAKLVFPFDYPLSPPKMQFTCEMFHTNSAGEIGRENPVQ
jgi:ubiquitin-protein ligase